MTDNKDKKMEEFLEMLSENKAIIRHICKGRFTGYCKINNPDLSEEEKALREKKFLEKANAIKKALSFENEDRLNGR